MSNKHQVKLAGHYRGHAIYHRPEGYFWNGLFCHDQHFPSLSAVKADIDDQILDEFIAQPPVREPDWYEAR